MLWQYPTLADENALHVLFSYHSGKGAPGAGNREDEGATAGFSRENPLPHHPW